MANSNTDTTQFFQELDGGVFEEKIGHALSKVAAHVMDHEQKGELTIKLEISKLSSSQVNVKHKLSLKHPTLRGDESKNDTTATPMHVGRGGAMTFFPEGQGQLLTSQGEPASGKSLFPQPSKGNR